MFDVNPKFACSDYTKEARAIVEYTQTTTDRAYGVPGLQLLQLELTVVLVLMGDNVSNH